MKALWTFLFLLACFGIVGRIEYESELDMEAFRKEYAQNFHNRRAASVAAAREPR
jgi:hypothetical protein